MATKTYELDSIGTLTVFKRRGAKNMRLSIAADGKVRVTIPAWGTYSSALDFAESRSRWINANRPIISGLLQHGQQIGKAHRLHFDSDSVTLPRSRISGSQIRITRPEGCPVTHPEVQTTAQKASIRALRLQAEKLLPGRLRQLAEDYGFAYTGVQVKQLKGRWGSCDSNRQITLNLFLMQLPWKLIDYVLVHELVHTKHMNHSEEFWTEFLRHQPYAKEYRRLIRTHKPVLETVELAQPVQ